MSHQCPLLQNQVSGAAPYNGVKDSRRVAWYEKECLVEECIYLLGPFKKLGPGSFLIAFRTRLSLL
jgi:hypothetical protein